MIDTSNLSIGALPEFFSKLTTAEIVVLVIMLLATCVIFVVFVRIILIALTKTMAKREQAQAAKSNGNAAKVADGYSSPEQYGPPEPTLPSASDIDDEKKRIMEQLKKELNSTK